MAVNEITATFGRILKYKDIIALCFSVLLALFTFVLLIIGAIENSFNFYSSLVEFETKIYRNNNHGNVLLDSHFPYVYIYYPRYPLLLLSILGFVLSILAIITNILFILRKVKKYPVIGMAIVSLLFLSIFIQTYFWVALNGFLHLVYQLSHYYSSTTWFRANNNDYSINTTMQTPLNLGQYSTISFLGTFISIFTLITSVIYVIFHYLFASNLEGPTISEMVNGWVNTLRSSIFGGSAQGYMLVKNKLWGKTVVKIRKINSQFFREVELEHNTYDELLHAISNTFNVSTDDIRDIIKDGNTIINSDQDVKRIPSGTTIEFSSDNSASSNIEINNDDDQSSGQFVEVTITDDD